MAFWDEEPMFEMGSRAFPLMPLLSFRQYHLNYPAHPHEEASSGSQFQVPLLTKLLT